MLRPFGSSSCPRCDTSLISTSGLQVGDDAYRDSHWLCPSCGYSRPVVYSVERTTRRPKVLDRFTRIWQSF